MQDGGARTTPLCNSCSWAVGLIVSWTLSGTVWTITNGQAVLLHVIYFCGATRYTKDVAYKSKLQTVEELGNRIQEVITYTSGAIQQQ